MGSLRKRPPPPRPLADSPPSHQSVEGFGIRAVSQLTEIDEHTLRMWERRYGFPRPDRSPGGARQYTTGDVQKLRLVRQARALGHRPREVVGRDLAALEALVKESAPNTVRPPQGMPSEVEAVLAAVMREDIEAIRVGLRHLALLYGPRDFVREVAQPLLVKVGQMWKEGTIEIRQEHLFSECLSTQLRILRSLYDNVRGPAVVLATLPNEPHGLGLEMVALYLATGGASPRVIGVSTPAEQIARASHAHQAAVVGLSVVLPPDSTHAASEIRGLLPALPRGTQLWLGGAGAANLPHLEGARVFAAWDDLDAALLALTTSRGHLSLRGER
jgi:MerR family transcriptional regulator, light-induced transcriptional regulator